MPRAGLSREVVVAEAARVADELGLENLTLAAVAARLGVKLPSLYKHVDGMDALQVELAIAADRELLADISAATVGRSGAEAVLALAHAYRRFARRRPGLYPLTLRAAEGRRTEHADVARALLDVVLAVVGGFALKGNDAIDAVRGLRALVHGFISIEAAGGFKLAHVDRSFQRLVESYADSLRGWSRKS